MNVIIDNRFRLLAFCSHSVFFLHRSIGDFFSEKKSHPRTLGKGLIYGEGGIAKRSAAIKSFFQEWLCLFTLFTIEA